MAGTPGQPAAVDPGRRRVAVTAAVAATAEWYDYQIFGIAAALVFGRTFFPLSSPVAGVLSAFATFAVGFLARPLGGVLAGHYGDKFGRKPMLVAALAVMGVATTLIGLLPGYATIGIAAPIGLVLLRLVQGVAVGAQWGGALLLATEYAPPGKRGIYGGFVQMGVPIGLATANGAFLAASALSGPDGFASWGWRLPFLLGIVLVGLAVFLHRTVEDTPEFRDAERVRPGTEQRSPLREVLRHHRRTVVLAAGAFTVVSATFYVLVAGVLDYTTRDLGMPRSQVLVATLITSVLLIGTLPLFAALSDRFGRLRVYSAGAICLVVWAVPMFVLVDSGTFLSVLIALFVGNLCLSVMFGPQAALFAELFDVRVRYTGASLGYQLGSLAGGAIAPFVMVVLITTTGSSLAVAAYVIALAVLALVSLRLIGRTRPAERDERAVEAEPVEAKPVSLG